MTIYAIGAEAMTWDYVSTLNSGTVGSDNAYGGNGPTMYIDASAALLSGTPLTEGWVRFNMQSNNGGTPTSLPIMAFFNSSTNKDALQITWEVASNTFAVKYNSSGTTYTSLGTFYGTHVGAYTGQGPQWSLYFKRGSSGVMRVFINDAIVFEYVGAINTVDSTFDGIRFRGNDNIRPFNFGAVIFSDEPMFNTQLAVLRPNAAGNEQAWALNTFANVDDTAFFTEFEDGNYVNTSGSAMTHAFSDLTGYTNRRFPYVIGYVHGSIGAGATPTGMSFRVRQGTTNYTKSAMSVTSGDAPKCYRDVYTVDMLGNPWTAANINGLHFGAITT